jgi:hypothetical protein
MRRELGKLIIDRLIIHEVPKHTRADTTSTPIYSDIESPLDQELRIFFRDKFIETIGGAASFNVVFNEKTTSPVPTIIADLLLSTSSDFIADSRAMAQHLHNSQTGVNPGGLVTVADCKIDRTRVIGILKLEKEEGVRLAQTSHEGKRTFDVRLIRDLILTKKTKLFKIGLFSATEQQEIAGIVCDEQRGYLPRTEIAGFFLTGFLGCRLVDDPRVTTKKFFMAAQDFFNEKITDPGVRAEALTHLVSELLSHRTQLNVKTFARDYLPPEQRQAFVTHLQEHGVAHPTIVKDNALIASQTKKMAIEFQNGISVTCDPEAYGDSVRMKKLASGDARVEVTGKLKKVRTK